MIYTAMESSLNYSLVRNNRANAMPEKELQKSSAQTRFTQARKRLSGCAAHAHWAHLLLYQQPWTMLWHD